MKKYMKLGIKLFLAVSLLIPMHAIPAHAEGMDITTEMTFQNDAASRKDITSLLPGSENDTMIWQGEFKTTEAAIQTLISVCSEDAGNDHYLTLYLRGTTIGFEFKSPSGTVSKSVNVTASTLNDGNWHPFVFTVSPKGYQLNVDGSEVYNAADTPIMTSMNTYTNKSMYLGGMKRVNSAYAEGDGRDWYFNGSMRNVKIIGRDSTQKPNAVLTAAGGDYSASNHAEVNQTVPSFLTDSNLTNASFSITYRLAQGQTQSSALHTLFSVYHADNEYATFYLRPSTGTYGLEVKNGISPTVTYSAAEELSRIQNTQWHTVTFTLDGSSMRVILDDLDAKSASCANFWGSGTWAQTAAADGTLKMMLGGMPRTANQWYLNGFISEVRLYDTDLTADDIAMIHTTTASEAYPTNPNMSINQPEVMYNPGDYGSAAYRIPSLITTSAGTVIAGIDKRNDGEGDWYNIDSVVRRKESGAAAFGEPIKVLDLIERTDSSEMDSFLIDMSLTEATLANGNKRIFMLVDMFPQSMGLLKSDLLHASSGYKTVNGQKYLILQDDANTEYTVRENGAIFDAADQPTGETMIVPGAGTQADAYHDLGTIKDAQGNSLGNAYMYDGPDKGKYHVIRTQYLWMTYSDDDGKTWASPTDLTPQVKADWMVFLGTGPGVGIQLKHQTNTSLNNRLVFPVYHANSNIGGSQASNVIYSDDFGVTWKLGQSPLTAAGVDVETMNSSSSMLTEAQVVELNSGKLMLFMRNPDSDKKVKVATSTDGGATWSAASTIDVFDSYCQMSVLHTEYNGQEYVFLSNPSAGGRQDLAITMGTVNADDSITWGVKHIYYYGHGQYSCISETTPGNIGVLFEGHTAADYIQINYLELPMDYLLSKVDLSAPIVTNISKDLMKSEATDASLITAGDEWKYVVTLNKPLFVSGTPQLPLTVAGQARNAVYVSGNGTDKLVFKYTVAADDKEGAILAKKAITAKEATAVAESFYNIPIANSEASLSAGYIGYNFASDVKDLEIVNAVSGNEAWGATKNAYDKNEATIWHSNSIDTGWITLELAKDAEIEGIRYLTRQDTGENGIITAYNIYVGDSADNLQLVSQGTWDTDKSDWKGTRFSTPVTGRFVKLQATAGVGSFASAAEIGIFGKIALKTQALKDLIAACDALSESDYTPSSWAPFQAELTKAKQVLANPSDQEAVNTAVADLTAKKQALQECADKTVLAQAIADAKIPADGMYTKASIERFNAIIAAAQEVLNDPAAVDDEVAEAVTKVTNAGDVLVNVTVLDEVLTQAKAEAAKENLTLEYQTALNAAISAASDLITNELVQSNVDAAITALQELLKAPEYKGDKTALQQVIQDAAAIAANKDSYTAESYQALEAALAQANSVNADKDAKQSVIDQAQQALQTALASLKKAETNKPTQPEDPKDDYVTAVENQDSTVIAEGKFPIDVILKVEEADTKAVKEIKAIIKDQTIIDQYQFEAVYDVYMLQNGAVYQPEGTITISIKLKDTQLNKKLKVVHITEDGKVTEMPSKVENGYIKFKTNHFSYYALLSEKIDSKGNPVKETGEAPFAGGFSAVIAVGAILLLMTKKMEDILEN